MRERLAGQQAGGTICIFHPYETIFFFHVSLKFVHRGCMCFCTLFFFFKIRSHYVVQAAWIPKFKQLFSYLTPPKELGS